MREGGMWEQKKTTAKKTWISSTPFSNYGIPIFSGYLSIDLQGWLYTPCFFGAEFLLLRFLFVNVDPPIFSKMLIQEHLQRKKMQ
jgi:hypothetical protein